MKLSSHMRSSQEVDATVSVFIPRASVSTIVFDWDVRCHIQGRIQEFLKGRGGGGAQPGIFEQGRG